MPGVSSVQSAAPPHTAKQIQQAQLAHQAAASQHGHAAPAAAAAPVQAAGSAIGNTVNTTA